MSFNSKYIYIYAKESAGFDATGPINSLKTGYPCATCFIPQKAFAAALETKEAKFFYDDAIIHYI